MASVFSIGAVVLLPVLVLVPTSELVTGPGLVLAVYLGALPTALAYTLFARGLQRIGAGETATLTLGEPVTAAALGFIVLGERPGAAALGARGSFSPVSALLALRPKAQPRMRARPAEAVA